MGCDCAPKVADLFLYWYEHDYISKAVTKTELLSVIHVLKYCSRYIDDLNVPNASEEICRIVFEEIYPEEHSIESTNTDLMIPSFLDLHIFVRSEGFLTKLYDKRQDFSFSVVTFANLSYNIPNSQAYGSFKAGELYRICKSSTRLTDFKDETKMLVIKLKNQNFKFNELKRRISSFMRSKPACLHKFSNNVTVNDIIGYIYEGVLGDLQPQFYFRRIKLFSLYYDRFSLTICTHYLIYTVYTLRL